MWFIYDVTKHLWENLRERWSKEDYFSFIWIGEFILLIILNKVKGMFPNFTVLYRFEAILQFYTDLKIIW